MARPPPARGAARQRPCPSPVPPAWPRWWQRRNRGEQQPPVLPAQSPQHTHRSFSFLRDFLPARFSVIGPPGPVTVAMGEDVLLPCRVSPEQDVRDAEVIWFRGHFPPFVHRYKERQDQYGEQLLPFQGRTTLPKDGFANGSVALEISRVQLPDRGNYTCFVRRGPEYDEAVVELKVTGL